MDRLDIRQRDKHALREGYSPAVRRFETDATVACIVPGYERSGTELVGEQLVTDDPPFAWEVEGRCGFASDFDYASDAAK